MWGAVVAFYALIPKLYNMGLKHDPGLKGLVDEQTLQDDKNAKKESKDNIAPKPADKNVAFTGSIYQKAGEAAYGSIPSQSRSVRFGANQCFNW